jgi:hypothetical protein
LPSSTTDEKEDESFEVQIKQVGGSWWRILKLGRQEWKLYVLGFSFLLTAATGKMII